MDTACSSNLCQQISQRERQAPLQQHSHIFAAHLYRERYRLARNLYQRNLNGHYGCVNAIEFSHGGRYLASGGDDKRVLVWDVERALAGMQPRVLDTEHTSNIFCLGFDSQNRRVLSGGNDDLVIVHDFETGKRYNIFNHDNPVYGLSVDPQCDSVFATACEDGQILVFDQRNDPTKPFVLAQLHASFHAVEYHPNGNFLVTANSKRGAAFWDIRRPNEPVIQYGYVVGSPSCMSVRFNSTGSLILALRRRLPPILYNTQSPEPICTFYHGNYYNSCTMKSCTFAGEDDEFVLSGSDDFNLYVWRLSDVDLERTEQWVESTQMILYGHRSIVNQVRYNREKCLLASSGVEKIVKLWSPFEQRGWSGSLLQPAVGAEYPRDLFSPYNFASMSTPPHSWGNMSHDYSGRNTNEDARMMAFFDSLIQQEIEAWDTDSSPDTPMSSPQDAYAGGGDGGYHVNVSSQSSSDDSSSDTSIGRGNAGSHHNEDDDDDDNDDDDDQRGGGAARLCRIKRARLYRVKKSILALRSATRQDDNHANRIAFLIATKRNRLRRLAIRSASTRNRPLCNVLKLAKERSKATRADAADNSRQCLLRSRSSDSEIASTSAAAASVNEAAAATKTKAAVAPNQWNTRRTPSTRRKRRKLPAYESSSSGSSCSSVEDVEEGMSNKSAEAAKEVMTESNHTNTVDSSSRFNADNEAASNNVNSNNVVASTSTGITSSSTVSMVVRVRRQPLFDSEDDVEDDNETADDAKGKKRRPNTAIERATQPNGKLNGTHSAADECEKTPTAATRTTTTTNTMLPQTTRATQSNVAALGGRRRSAAAGATATLADSQTNGFSQPPSNATAMKRRRLAAAADYAATPLQEQPNGSLEIQLLAESTPAKSRTTDRAGQENNTSGTTTNGNAAFYMSDSGISVSTDTPTPTTTQTNGRRGSPIPTASTSNSPAYNSNTNYYQHSTVENPGDANNNGHSATYAAFKQKVARVRRSYRKRFAEEDSDSD